MDTASAPAPAGGLRDRRRRETTVEICEAALDLFEQNGVSGTTVDEIAARAGISPRTFFRLAGTKEDAVFVDDGRFVEALAGIGAAGDDVATLTAALRAVFARELTQLDTDPRARERYLRVRRLIAHEPALLGAAVRREVTSSDRLVPDIAERIGQPDIEVRAALGLAGLEMRMTLDDWARRHDRGEASRLEDLHGEVRRHLARAADSE